MHILCDKDFDTGCAFSKSYPELNCVLCCRYLVALVKLKVLQIFFLLNI